MIKSFNIKKDRKIYGNYKVLSPDNILMFMCDEKKANWYLNRNLADTITDNTIRLNFKPNGLGNHNKSFGLSEMSNRCVVCGTDEYITRHHVVPYCYRKYFPIEIKSHKFHDVLPVCADCHESYERSASVFKKEIANIYNAPINGEFNTKSYLNKYSKLATSLLNKDSSNLPNKRIISIKLELKKFFNIKKITAKKLEEISKIKYSVINKTHGEIVVSKLDDINKFIKMWREHFIKNNDCKYLPKNWNIDNE